MDNNTLDETKVINNIELEPTECQSEKKILLDRFLNIGSKKEIEKLADLENDLIRFNTKNNDKDIERLLIVFEVFKINVFSKEVHDLSEEFYDLFMELSKKKDLTFFEIRLLLIMFVATDEPKEIVLTTNHLLSNIDNHISEPDYFRVKFSIYQNASDVLLNQRYLYDTYKKDEYDKFLKEYLLNAIELSKQYDNEYWSIVVRLKLGILLENDFMIKTNIEELKSLNDEVIDKHIKSIISDFNIEY